MLSLVQFTYSPATNISYCWNLSKDRWFLSTFQTSSLIPEIFKFYQTNFSHSIFFCIFHEQYPIEKENLSLYLPKIVLFLENVGGNIVYRYWTASAQSHIPLNSFVAWQNVNQIVATNHGIYPMHSNRAPYHTHSLFDMSLIWPCALPSQNEYQGLSHLFMQVSWNVIWRKFSSRQSWLDINWLGFFHLSSWWCAFLFWHFCFSHFALSQQNK